MSQDITLTFTVDTNDALLLLTLHDLLTIDHFDDSFVIADNYQWLSEEIGMRADDWLSWAEYLHGKQQLSPYVKAFLSINAEKVEDADESLA